MRLYLSWMVVITMFYCAYSASKKVDTKFGPIYMERDEVNKVCVVKFNGNHIMHPFKDEYSNIPEYIETLNKNVSPYNQIIVLQAHMGGNACEGGPFFFFGIKSKSEADFFDEIGYCLGDYKIDKDSNILKIQGFYIPEAKEYIIPEIYRYSNGKFTCNKLPIRVKFRQATMKQNSIVLQIIRETSEAITLMVEFVNPNNNEKNSFAIPLYNENNEFGHMEGWDIREGHIINFLPKYSDQFSLTVPYVEGYYDEASGRYFDNYIQQADLEHENKNYRKSLELYKKSESYAQTREEKIRIWASLAQANYDMKNFGNSKQFCDKILEINPNNEWAKKMSKKLN